MWKELFSSKLKGTFLPKRTISSNALQRLEQHSKQNRKIGTLEDLLDSKDEEFSRTLTEAQPEPVEGAVHPEASDEFDVHDEYDDHGEMDRSHQDAGSELAGFGRREPGEEAADALPDEESYAETVDGAEDGELNAIAEDDPLEPVVVEGPAKEADAGSLEEDSDLGQPAETGFQMLDEDGSVIASSKMPADDTDALGQETETGDDTDDLRQTDEGEALLADAAERRGEEEEAGEEAPADDPLAAPPPAEAVTLKSLRAVAQRIAGAAQRSRGYAVIISADTPDADITREVVNVTREIADTKVKTMLLDRSESLHVISSVLGLPRTPGMKELLCGRASVEDVIKRDPESNAQVITAGNPRLPSKTAGGQVGLEMMVDALNEVYDCLIIHADFATARELFGELGSHVSATVTIGSDPQASGETSEFLGIEATNKTLIRYENPDARRPTLFGFRLPG